MHHYVRLGSLLSPRSLGYLGRAEQSCISHITLLGSDSLPFILSILSLYGQLKLVVAGRPLGTSFAFPLSHDCSRHGSDSRHDPF